MFAQSEIESAIQDLLAILDASEYPAIYHYLGDLLSNDADEVSPMEVVAELQSMGTLPQVVWDFIIEILETEIENGNIVFLSIRNKRNTDQISSQNMRT
ncbi:MAG: hypothetical protein IK118_03620 [Clostridia bacterium]|nr:hypothetical protein [Clostridia bacterium]MBR5427412.1 hypothetical protein [Clostridia bacterium]